MIKWLRRQDPLALKELSVEDLMADLQSENTVVKIPEARSGEKDAAEQDVSLLLKESM